MTFAHLSDTHLGFRAYGRTTPQGFNQREVDVMRTFRNVLGAIGEREPDVVVHSGDLFHVVRPSNATIHGAFRAITELQVRRGGRPFILIGGNHDTPRMAESGNILNLFAEIPGVDVRGARSSVIDIPDLDLEVLCVPSNSLLGGERLEWAPTLGRAHSLLTLHGMARQAVADAGTFDVGEARHDRWTYVALGDYHVHKAFGRNVCYAGSTDFASTNIWEEAGRQKGWVWFDTAKGRLEFVPTQTRTVIDLPRIDAHGMTPEQLATAIRQNAAWDGAEMPVVRQRVANVHPDVRARLGAGIIRELNARCLSYVLRLLPPELASSDPASPRTEAITLEKSWERHVEKAELPGGVDRAALRDLGLELLKEVAERAADPATA